MKDLFGLKPQQAAKVLWFLEYWKQSEFKCFRSTEDAHYYSVPFISINNVCFDGNNNFLIEIKWGYPEYPKESDITTETLFVGIL